MWAKLDDGFMDHRKVFKAGDAIGKNGPAIVIGFYAVGLMWTNKHLTDGFLPVEVVRRFHHVGSPTSVAGALVKAGLWDATDGGYRIHDYEKYNQSAADVLAGREWDVRRKQLYSDPELLDTVRGRDKNRCRYCGCLVNWRDRRGPQGGQYDHVIPRGENTAGNIVVACRGCNGAKKNRTPEQAGMALLEPGSYGTNGANGRELVVNGHPHKVERT